MKFYSIEVDDEVYTYLQNQATPFQDNPNSVLRRILLSNKKHYDGSSTTVSTDLELPEFQAGTPKALEQILQIVFLIKNENMSRIVATNILAKIRGVAHPTIIDKYTRQLNLTASDVEYLIEHDLAKFKNKLINKFPLFVAIINSSFANYESNSSMNKQSIIGHYKSAGSQYKLNELLPKKEADLGSTKPEFIKIEDDVYPVKNWTDLMLKFVGWLIKNDKLRKSDLPIYTARTRGKSKYFINDKRSHSTNDLDALWNNVDGFYVDTKYNVERQISNIDSTLKQLKINDIDIIISVKLNNRT